MHQIVLPIIFHSIDLARQNILYVMFISAFSIAEDHAVPSFD